MNVMREIAVRPQSEEESSDIQSKEVVISCENVHKTYLMGIEGVAALRGVSVDVYAGEFLVIFGTSGGGKTTLLNVLGTIDTATKGNVVIMGKRVTDKTSDTELAAVRLHSLGFVFQSFNLLSTMTASENVELPMVLAGNRDARSRKTRVTELLTSVGLEHRLNHLPSQMSGGEQQRTTIARALANEPSILLMDEPTGDLDTKNTLNVLDILLRLNAEKKITIVMVTHDPNMKNYAHRALYMRDGKVSHIEETESTRRSEAIAQLQRDVQSYQAKSPLQQGEAAGAAAATARLEVRTRADYATARAMRSASAMKQSTNQFMNEKVLWQLFGVKGGPLASAAEVEVNRIMTPLFLRPRQKRCRSGRHLHQRGRRNRRRKTPTNPQPGL